MQKVFLIFVLAFTIIATQDYTDSSPSFVDGSDEVEDGKLVMKTSAEPTNDDRKKHITSEDKKNEKRKKIKAEKTEETDDVRNDKNTDKTVEELLQKADKEFKKMQQQNDSSADPIRDAIAFLVHGSNQTEDGDLIIKKSILPTNDDRKRYMPTKDKKKDQRSKTKENEETGPVKNDMKANKSVETKKSDKASKKSIGLKNNKTEGAVKEKIGQNPKTKVNSSIPKIKSNCCNAQIINVFHYLDLESRHMCFKKLEVQNLTVEKQVQHRACVAECIARHKRYLTSRGKLFVNEFTNNLKVAFRELQWIVKMLDEIVNTCVEKYELYTDTELGCSTKILNIGQCVGRKLQYECYENFLPNEDECLQDFFDVKYYKCIAPSPGFGCHTIR